MGSGLYHWDFGKCLIFGDLLLGGVLGNFKRIVCPSSFPNLWNLRKTSRPAPATYIASHHPSYVRKFDLLKPLLKKGTFTQDCVSASLQCHLRCAKHRLADVLNTYQSKEEVMQTLPMRMKRQLAEKEAGFFIIDANKVAKEAGLGENINMGRCFCKGFLTRGT